MTGNTDAVQEPDRAGAEVDLTSAINEFLRSTFDETERLETTVARILSEADRVFHSARKKPCKPAVLSVLAARHGLLGRRPITLQEAGRAVGVTRERARQIAQRHQALFELGHLWWPQLDHALELARNLAPCPESALADELLHKGITTGRYSFGSLHACAEFAGRSVDLEVKYGVVIDDPDTFTAARRTVRKLTERQGLAALSQVREELLNAVDVDVTEGDLRELLSGSPPIVWLDADHVIWDAPGKRNRLTNTLRTLLTVHQPVDLPSAQQAVARFWAYRNASLPAHQADLMAPTVDEIRMFCEWHDQFTVDDAGIGATVPLIPETELGTEAALLVELIRTSPNGVLDRASLMETADAYDLNLSTVSIYLSFHPAFVQLEQNAWTVRGTEVSPEVVAAVQREARERTRAQNHDFRADVAPDGRPWLLLAVTSNFRLTGVLMRRWLPPDTPSARFALIDGRGERCGTASHSYDTGFTHGFGTYIRRFDVQIGEYIYLSADLDEKTATITHGSADEITGLAPTNPAD